MPRIQPSSQPEAIPPVDSAGEKRAGRSLPLPIRVLIVDDHAVLRAGLEMLINAQPGMTVAGEAENGDQALEKVSILRPDVVILDLTMPGINGLTVIPNILSRRPETRILVLTMHDDPAYLRSVLAAGGAGYVVKRAADSELLSAIRTVHRGKTFIDRTLGDELIQDLLGRKTEADGSPADRLLSRREREVFRLLAQGFTNRQVAESLGVSVKTAETHRLRIFQKLGFRDRAELVRYAIEVGLLTLDSAP